MATSEKMECPGMTCALRDPWTKGLGEGEGWRWGGWRCPRQMENIKNCIILSNKKEAKIIHSLEGVNGSDVGTLRDSDKV